MKTQSVYIIVFLALSLLLLFILVLPEYQVVKSSRQAAENKKLEIVFREDYLKNLAGVSETLAQYQSPLSKIDSALPDDFSLPELLNFLQKTVAQSGLALKAMSPATLTQGSENQLQEARVNLSVGGSYADFKNLLSILEKSARLVEVENIAFSSSGSDQSTFNLTVKVYSY